MVSYSIGVSRPAAVADLPEQRRGPDHTGSQCPPDAAARFLTADAQRSQRLSQRCCLTFVTRERVGVRPQLVPGLFERAAGAPPGFRSLAALGTVSVAGGRPSRHAIPAWYCWAAACAGRAIKGDLRGQTTSRRGRGWWLERVRGSKAASRTARCCGLGRPFGAVENLSRSEHEGVRSSDDHVGAIGEDHRHPPLGDLHACVRHRRRKTSDRRHRKDRSPGSRCGLRRPGRESVDVGHQGRGAPSASLILYA